MNCDVCVIGAGPAGLMAAIAAGTTGVDVILAERNTSAARKLRHTGGGRCNLTHAGSIQDFVQAYGTSGRFLKHSLYEFSPDNLREYFADHGVPTKILEDGCIFPVTENAGDVARALTDHAKVLSVKLLYDKPVQSIEKTTNAFNIQICNETINAKTVIIATGGTSWPSTGSTGDGYTFAKQLGHTIMAPRAALTTLVAQERWIGQLAGVSVPSVIIKSKTGKHKLHEIGPLVFTDKGIGGPAVLNFSNHVTNRLPDYENPVPIIIDLLPGHEFEQLDKQIIELCAKHPKKEVPHALNALLPKALIGCLCDQIGGGNILTACTLTKKQRHQLVTLLRQLHLSIVATGPLSEATITRGGVCTQQINPQAMESTLHAGFFFAGEVLDVDGPCGGYNLQIAFSTGHLAGRSAAALACQK